MINIDEVLSISNRVLEYKFENKFINTDFLKYSQDSKSILLKKTQKLNLSFLPLN